MAEDHQHSHSSAPESFLDQNALKDLKVAEERFDLAAKNLTNKSVQEILAEVEIHEDPAQEIQRLRSMITKVYADMKIEAYSRESDIFRLETSVADLKHIIYNLERSQDSLQKALESHQALHEFVVTNLENQLQAEKEKAK